MATLELSWETTYARVRIVATGIEWETATIWRRAGRSQPQWTFVRSAYGADTTSGALVAYDYEMPIDGQEITYAIAEGTTPPPFDAPTWTITVEADQPWLRHLGVPGLSMPVTVATIDTIDHPGRIGIYEIVGRRDPVTVHDVRGSRRGTLTLLTRTADEAARMRTVIADGAPLLLQLSCVPVDFADCYMAITSVALSRVNPGRTTSTARTWEFAYVEVARPAGEVGFHAGRVWADVLAEQPTWAQVAAETPTWLHVLLGPDLPATAGGG